MRFKLTIVARSACKLCYVNFDVMLRWDNSFNEKRMEAMFFQMDELAILGRRQNVYLKTPSEQPLRP